MKVADDGGGILTGNVSMDDFELLKVLGKGAYGKVFQARKIRGQHQGHLYALKSVNKSRIASSQTDIRHTKAERDVLVRTDHPFIVKLFFAFETSKRLYLVQEFCRGGELFRRMEVERMMLEEHARFYLSQIVCALEYLHSIDIVYRDLKTENVMLDQAGHVKLIDFGLSKLNMNEGVLTNTFCGTVEYMAPEVVTRSPGYSKPADWWSFGIFTFDLLTGRSPFHSNRGKQETKERILRGKFHTPAFLTPQAQDLIRRLLRRPVDRRLGSKEGALEIKSHEFFNGICWEKVLKRDYEPPFIPSLSSEDDVSNFDTRFTSKSPRESDDLGSRNNAQETDGEPHMFKDFDYISPELVSTRLETSDKTTTSTGSSIRTSTSSGGATSDVGTTSNLTDEMQDLRIRGYGD